MVDVGFVAVVLNIVLMIVMVVAGRAVEFILCSFALSRLKQANRAPMVHDRDISLVKIPLSIMKYSKNPGIVHQKQRFA